MLHARLTLHTLAHRFAQQGGHGFIAIQQRQGPQTRPHAFVRHLLQPNLITPHRPQPPVFTLAAFDLAALDRVALRFTHFAGHTQIRPRAHQARGLARRAHRGAQVHQTLGVRRHHLGTQWQHHLSRRDQGFLVRPHGQILAPAQHTAEHALHIAIHDGDALVKAKRGNGGRCRRANARQGLQRL